MFSMFSKEARLTHFEWLFMLLFFPIIVTITPCRSPLLGLLLVPFLLRAYQKKPIFPSTPFNLPLFGLLAMVLVSLWATYDMALSIRKVSVLIWSICLFWSLQNGLLLHQNNKLWLVSLLCGVGITVSFIALFNPVIGLKIPGGNSLLNLFSSIPASSRLAKINPNEIGGILAWIIPLSVSIFVAFVGHCQMAFCSKKIINGSIYLLTAFAFVPMIIILFLTASRTAIAGTLFSLIFMGWLLGNRNIRWGIVMFLMLVGGAIIIDTLVFESSFVTGPLIDLVEGVSGKSVEGRSGLRTMSSRIEIWSRALFGIQDFSFTGMGMNTFREVVHILYPLFSIEPNVDIAHAHNQFLQVALDLGLPGLISFLAIWIILAILLLQCWRINAADPTQRIIIAGLTGAFLASFIFGLTDAITLGAIPNFIFWILLALACNCSTETTKYCNFKKLKET